jgi:hypothetical protein
MKVSSLALAALILGLLVASPVAPQQQGRIRS